MMCGIVSQVAKLGLTLSFTMLPALGAADEAAGQRGEGTARRRTGETHQGLCPEFDF